MHQPAVEDAIVRPRGHQRHRRLAVQEAAGRQRHVPVDRVVHGLVPNDDQIASLVEKLSVERVPELPDDLGRRLGLLARAMQDVEGMQLSVHDVLASDDHVVVLHEDTATRHGRTHILQFADIYHLRNGKATEHWHLAIAPKAEEAFWKS